MLTIKIPIVAEGWDEEKQEFVEPIEQVLELEHSLVSLSNWESKWCKSFIDSKDKTEEESLDYIRCMTLTPNVHPDIYYLLTDENVEEINKYINAPMTATTVKNIGGGKKRNSFITAEVIYDWMITLGIPLYRETWHINRLVTLIQVRSAKNQPAKKQSRADIVRSQHDINEANKKYFNTKG